jgi:para-nitrobenzyl esterase
MFACTGLAMNRALTDKIPVYAYKFSDGTAPSYVGPTAFPLLAAHTYELSYIFPGFRGGADVTVRLNRLQEKLSDEMVGYFANVAGLSARENEWPRFDLKRDNIMTFALPQARLVSGRFAEFHHCAFWDRTGTY